MNPDKIIDQLKNTDKIILFNIIQDIESAKNLLLDSDVLGDKGVRIVCMLDDIQEKIEKEME